MKKSEYLARYWFFKEDIVPIEPLEFYETMKENIVGLDVRNYHPTEQSEAMEFSIDGWDYYSFGAHWNEGWMGDVNCDSFKFKIARATAQERLDMINMFSKNNCYE